MLIYAAYRFGGYFGLMLLFCALASGFCVLLYLLGWLAGGDRKVIMLDALMGWLFGTVGFALRPQMVGSLFSILVLVLIELGRRHNYRWLWGLPPLFALWVNCHPSQILGLIVLAAYWAFPGRIFVSDRRFQSRWNAANGGVLADLGAFGSHVAGEPDWIEFAALSVEPALSSDHCLWRKSANGAQWTCRTRAAWQCLQWLVSFSSWCCCAARSCT